jgi:hypothetical protein
MVSMVTLLMTSMTPPNHAGQIGVEADAWHRRIGVLSARPGQVFVDLAEGDALDVGGADEGLAHDRRVDVELDFRVPAGQHVALEMVRDDQREVVGTEIHPRSSSASVKAAGCRK